MGDFSHIIYLIVAIDLIASLIVGASVFCHAESFWNKAENTRWRVLTSTLRANGYNFFFCALLFMIVHVWAWAPFNVASPFVPFNVTWKFALLFASIATLGWMLPLRRVMMKLSTICAPI